MPTKVSSFTFRKMRSSLLRGISHLSLVHSGGVIVVAGIAGVVSIAVPNVAQAQSPMYTDPSYTPGTASYHGQAKTDGGGTWNLTGSTPFSGGVNSVAGTNITYSDALAGGYISGPAIPATSPRLGTNIGSAPDYQISVPDPASGGTNNIRVYSSSNFAQNYPGVAFTLYTPTPAGSGPFVEATVVAVTGGGTINANITGQIGDTTVKKTTYAEVRNGTLNWQSNNVFRWGGGLSVDPAALVVPSTLSVTPMVWKGSVTVDFGGGDSETRSVTNLAEYRAYNDWLRAQFIAGRFGVGTRADMQAKYDYYIDPTRVSMPGTSITYTVSGATNNIPADDPMFVDSCPCIAISSDGVHSLANIVAGGGVTVQDKNAYLTVVTDRGRVVNHVGATMTSLGQSDGFGVATGGQLTNYGLMRPNASYIRNVGSVVNNDGGTIDVKSLGGAQWLTIGATGTTHAANAGGAFNNINNAVVNVSDRGNSIRMFGGSTYNDATSVIYLGRGYSTSPDSSIPAIDRGGALVYSTYAMYAIWADGNDNTVLNAGTIVVGDGLQSSSAIRIVGGTNNNIVNSGKIIVGGHNSAAPLLNTGIYASDSAKGTISNTGLIQINGINVVGIYTLSGAQTSSSGIINVTDGGGSSANMRNYGVWSEGNTTLSTLSGTINLSGNYAVATHVRNQGRVDVIGSGTVNFLSGTHQIGFFAYGANSTLSNTSSGAQNVSTAYSTLYRLENGADLSGSSSTTMTASGANSVAVLVTGRATTTDVSAFNSGGMTINLSGTNSLGVRVEGGAQGKITSGTTINLTGAGAIAGIADGQKYGLDGAASGAPIAGVLSDASLAAGATGFGAGTVLVSEAALSSGMNDVTGYISRNGATLSNAGNISFSGTNSTGMLIEVGSTGVNTGTMTMTGAGSHAIKVLNGTLNNTGSITSNGVGVYVEGTSASITNTGAILATDGPGAAIEMGVGTSLTLSGVGTIEGRGSAHGVLIDPGAVALNVTGAHINVGATGASGHGIENAGEIAGLKLTNTTIDVMNGVGVRTAAPLDPTNSGTINVLGSGTGILIQEAGGSTTTNALDLSGSSGLTINVTGAGGSGLYADSTGTVNTAITVHVTNAAGGSALSVGDAVTTVINSGELTSTSTVAPTVDANGVTSFTNTASGSISAAPGSEALLFDGQATTLTNAGSITGLVDLGAGDNVLINTGLITGDVTAAGNNTMTIDGGTVTGAITVTADGDNTLLLTHAATLGSFVGSGGDDTVTVRGSGNTFGTLNGATGNDTLIFDAAAYTLTPAMAVTNFEQVNLINASELTLQAALSTPGIYIDGTSKLIVAPAPAGAFTLANALTGTGLVTVNTGAGNAFNFDTTTGSAFAGIVAMGPSTFTLGGVNTTALINATLRVDAGSLTTVADGTQTIGGLTFNGGTVIFNAVAPADKVATSLIRANTLNISGTGIVRVTVPDPYVVATPTPATEYSLLEQDDIRDGLKLVSATTVTGTGAGLSFVDQNGIVVSDARDVDIEQGSNVVAVGTYDYGAGSGAANDGLYVGYRLQQLDLKPGQSLTLTEVPGLSGVDADLSAKLTGTGNLVVAANSIVSLSNGANDFTGTTLVSAGTLQAGANNVIATSRAVTVNTTFDTHGYTQSLNNLSGAVTGHVIIGSTTLTLNNTADTVFAGHMDGAAGQLVKNGAAALSLTGDTELAGLTVNDGTISFAPTTTIATAATAVTMNGGTARFTGGTVTSGGDAFSALAGVSTVELFGTSVTAGGLLLNVASGANHTLIADATTLVGDVRVAGTGLVDLRNASSLTGTAMGGNMTIDATSSWMLTGNSSITTLTNAGLVDVGGSFGAHRTLTVQNLIGNNGVVRLHTVLGGDGSPSDRIVVNGGSATGMTRLAIVQVGGLGAATPGNGIQVVEAQNGATTGGAFTLAGPVAAGAYEYALFQGARDGSTTDSWYLRSEEPPCEVTNTCPPPPPVPPPADKYRAEVSLYAVANSMPLIYGRTLLDGLHKRVGEEEDLRGRLGQSGGSYVNGAWGRMIGQFGEIDGNGARGSGPDYDYKLYTMQSGMDVFRHTDDNGHRDHVGFYLAAGRMEADVVADSGRLAGHNVMDAYSLGGYWTHFGPTGWYVDAVLQGSLYNMDITSVRGLGNITTDGFGVAASLEAGYPINLGGKLILEPQAQIVWQMTYMNGGSADENTRVDFRSGRSVAGRLGARLANSWTLQEGTQTASPLLLTAWVSPNVWHEFSGNTHTTVAAADGSNGVRFNSDIGGTWGEVNIGVNAQINRATSLIANVGYSFGLGSDVDRTAYEGRVGLRLNW